MKPIPKEARARILSLFDEGKTPVEIIAITGLSDSSVYYWLKKDGKTKNTHGGDRRPKHRRKDINQGPTVDPCTIPLEPAPLERARNILAPRVTRTPNGIYLLDRLPARPKDIIALANQMLAPIGAPLIRYPGVAA